MRCNLSGIQLLIYHLCGYTDRRLCDQNIAVRHLRQSCQLLADSFCQHRPSHDAVRHIRSKQHSSLHQFLLGKPQPKHLIHPK
ncbi:hypothetical protein EVA_11170 [gut metagenome]|uniref:Uncharacterized protein n=1 Tax=gut metagenome TaxID=749906 RepID=J9CKX9_9ZZZZ